MTEKMSKRNQKPNSAFSDFLLAKNAPRADWRDQLRADFGFAGRRLLRLVSLVVLMTMTAMLLRGIGGTVAYLSDSEKSTANEFAAGRLDFALETETAASSSCALPGKPLEKIIRLKNFGNPFQYAASSTDLTGDFCDYVLLEADIGGGEPEYYGFLKNFNLGLTSFDDPSDWTFKLSAATNTPPELAGQTCGFHLDFQGVQTRHDLAFPEGFSDFESAAAEIAAPYCYDHEIRSVGYWKAHPDIYLPLLPQFLGATTTDASGQATGTDEVIDTKAKVLQIFKASDSLMRNKLKKQLLAMKFNIVNFHIGGYVPAGGPDDLDAIVEQADALLRLHPEPPANELEVMKNLLESLNTMEFVSLCSCEPPPPPESCALRLTKTADKAEAAPGEEINYHLTLDNYGSEVCTGGGVRIKDTYPDSFQYLGFTSNRILRGVIRSAGYVEWNFGSVYPDDPTIEIDLQLRVSEEAACDSALVNAAKFWSDQTGWGAPVTATSSIVCASAALEIRNGSNPLEETPAASSLAVTAGEGAGETPPPETATSPEDGIIDASSDSSADSEPIATTSADIPSPLDANIVTAATSSIELLEAAAPDQTAPTEPIEPPQNAAEQPIPEPPPDGTLSDQTPAIAPPEITLSEPPLATDVPATN